MSSASEKPVEAGPSGGAGPSPETQASSDLTRLKATQKELQGVLRAVAALTKPGVYSDRKRLEKAVQKNLRVLPQPLLDRYQLRPLLDTLESRLHGAAERVRREIGEVLPELAQAAGLHLRIISAGEPLEIRLPPFGVTIHSSEESAELYFAKINLAKVQASAREILQAVIQQRKLWEKDFSASAFHEQCWTAYRAALAARGLPSGSRVEINDLLVFVAAVRQGSRFRVDPVAKNFESYSRAQFAFEVMLLVGADGLEQNGRRMNFGVATGNTTATKSRVLFLEDADGRGEYKLTLFFTQAGEAQ